MGFFDKLFRKNKSSKLGEDDGQAEFFKEDFEPVRSSTPKKVASSAEKSPLPTKAKGVEKAASAKPASSAKKKNSSYPAAMPKTAKKVELADDSPEVKGAATVKEGKATANGKWDIRKAKDGRYFFNLYASNHTVIAYSQIYSSISAVTTGMSSVIANCNKAEIEDTTLKNPTSLPCPKWEIYIDKAEQYRFRLYATNGLIVCHSSHGYASKSGCKGGIESIKRFASEARVDKSYLK